MVSVFDCCSNWADSFQLKLCSVGQWARLVSCLFLSSFIEAGPPDNFKTVSLVRPRSFSCSGVLTPRHSLFHRVTSPLVKLVITSLCVHHVGGVACTCFSFGYFSFSVPFPAGFLACESSVALLARWSTEPLAVNSSVLFTTVQLK